MARFEGGRVMKKRYKKPIFYAEPLVLTSSFASCNAVGTPNVSNPDTCSYTDEQWEILFYGNTGSCDWIMEQGSTNSGYICYNTPNDSGNIIFVNS